MLVKVSKRFLVLIIVLGVIFDIGYSYFKVNNKVADKASVKPTLSAASDTGLADAVQSTLSGTQGTYSIYIKNLKTGEQYTKDEQKVYQTGSLYKLWIMAVAFQMIQNGTLSEDQTLSEDVSTLNSQFNIDPADAEQTGGVVTFTVRDALFQMITISHNYAALLLTENEKLSNVQQYLQNYNFSNSAVGINGDAPTSTASDIGLFMEKLYKGQLANPQYTKEMLDLLKQQKLNNKLPLYLPPGTVIAHKTGEIDNLSHDAGIVYSPKGDYIIVVLSESDNPPAAEEQIGQISKNIYEYFTNK